MKSGLEVHHQILTEGKLFCRCPAGLYTNKHDAEILRHMRPTLSELGEYDGTALMEFKTKKEIIYLLDYDTVCTYEMDDTPPFPINQEAVDIAIEIALMLNCKIVSEIHIARKQYLDGSIPAGFQRTTIIGVDGWVPYKDRKIHIVQLALEEDACREISDIGHVVTFKTDRLSMPLIEVVTAPEMVTPNEVAEVGRIIGRLLRSTGKVRRGLGSVRQDVNVSIEGGTRVEIKGVPRIPLFPALVYNEAYRQHNLLKIKDFLTTTIGSIEDLKADEFDLQAIASKVSHRLIKKSIEKRDAKLRGVVFRNLKGLLRMTTQPGLTFAHELSERVRVIACLDQLPNLLHTEDVSVAGLEPKDQQLLAKAMNLNKNDTAIIAWGSEQDVKTAIQEIILRVQEAFGGVPNETRQAKSNGLTDFERILPGADRMYPDTDSPPTAITLERIEKIRAQLSRPPWELEKKYTELGIAKHQAEILALHPQRAVVEAVLAKNAIDPKLVVWTMIDLGKHLQRQEFPIQLLEASHWEKVFALIAEKKIYREGLDLLLTFVAAHPEEDPEDYLAAQNITPLLGDNLQKKIEKIAAPNRNLKLFDDSNWPKVLMGIVMGEIRGRAAGRDIWDIVKNQTR
ncbi:Glu-tRNA(Gln) amidotransferase subunit GatE [bacterium]|nr:Glu-tRNA(Gln) amidotransferase subunit GatE [bacterium]MBU1651046.1 Glu-tRNA(Gln) amidotransferase subunit GatE [bacterium]